MDLIVTSFVAGELHPEMEGRSDLPVYPHGCRLAENFLIKPTGGACRRPGFEEIAAAKSSAYAGRLVGFVQGTSRYVLWFGDYVMRVFEDGEPVLSGAAAYELATPYAYADLAQLVFAPRGQVIYHPSYDPRKLTCTSDAVWTLTAAEFNYGPLLKANEDTSVTITPSATTGSITLTATGGTPFVTGASGHVGALWQLTHEVDEAAVGGHFGATGDSAELPIKGTWELELDGHWAGVIKLQRSYDAGSTWKDVRVYERTIPSSVLIVDKGEETDDGVIYRVSCTTWTTSTGDLFDALFRLLDANRYQLKVRNMQQVGMVRITAVTSATVATATVLNTLGAAEATWRWAEGAWSPYRGYPACGTVHESRKWFARTSHQPTGVWATKSFLGIGDDRAMDYGTTVEADDALSRTIDQQGCNVIEWLASLWVMLVGADGGLFKAFGPSEMAPMTPSDVNTPPQSGMGSSSLQPEMIAGHLVYTGRNSKRVYEMTYSDDRRVYNPEDLTRYAEHITRDGIVGWAFMQQPYPILWAITDDGYLIGLTRDKQQDLMAWHRHSLSDGTFEGWPVVIPSDGDDELWVTVTQTVKGSTRRAIWRMMPFDWGTSQRDCFFVDGGSKWDGGAAVDITDIGRAADTGRVTVHAVNSFSDGWQVRLASVPGMTEVNNHVYTVADATGTTFALKSRDGSVYIDGSSFSAYTGGGGTAERVENNITGLGAFNGKTVACLADGQPLARRVVSGSAITFGTKDQHYYNTIVVGLPYTSKLMPMRPEARTMTGSIASRKKKFTYLDIEVYKTSGGKIGTSAADAQPFDYSVPGQAANADVTLLTGRAPTDGPGGWTEYGDIYIETDDPLPMTVTAIRFGLE